MYMIGNVLPFLFYCVNSDTVADKKIYGYTIAFGRLKISYKRYVEIILLVVSISFFYMK